MKTMPLTNDLTGVQYNVRVLGHSLGITESLITALTWFTESRSPEKVKEIIVLSTSK